jgi:hypothetical protein
MYATLTMKPGPMNLVYFTAFRRILRKKPAFLASLSRPGRAPNMHLSDRVHLLGAGVCCDVGGVALGVGSGAAALRSGLSFARGSALSDGGRMASASACMGWMSEGIAVEHVGSDMRKRYEVGNR